MKKIARIAGILYLALAITGGFGIMYVPANILVPSDAVTTAKNVMDNEWIFRLSIFSQMVSQTIFIFLVLILYRIFKDVDLNKARLMVGFVVVAVPIAFVNTLNQFIALRLLGGENFLNFFEKDQLDALVMIFLNLSNDGTALAQIFWGLWLFPFGLLVVKSSFIPKWMGYLLMVACIGYVANSIAHFLFPGYVNLVEPFTAVAGMAAEFSIIIWFLAKGVRDRSQFIGQ